MRKAYDGQPVPRQEGPSAAGAGEGPLLPCKDLFGGTSLPQGMRAPRVLSKDRWYVFRGMWPNRIFRIGFALLLSLMLPLQGYAAMPVCAQHEQSASSAAGLAAAPAGQQHCEHGNVNHHHCDNCCCGVAIALTPAQWTPPPPSALQASGAALRSSPTATLDRLDRPPRSILA
jgi:hypothetical protein